VSCELPLYGVLGRWDEKADPLRSTLGVCKGYTGSLLLEAQMKGGSAHE
jgi:hypothetical protein